MNRTQIVLADDHAMFREALRTLISHQSDLVVVGEAGTGPEAVDRVREFKPRLLCLDLSMPGWGLGVTIEKVLAVSANTRVLVLTMHDDPEYVRAAITAGATGYVVKTASTAKLLSAVRAVASGDRTFPTLVDQPPTAGAGDAVALSRREKEVIELLALGFTHQAVADRLFLSVKTVETYRSRIRAKTGLQTRADFVRYGLENGLLNKQGGNPPPQPPGETGTDVEG